MSNFINTQKLPVNNVSCHFLHISRSDFMLVIICIIMKYNLRIPLGMFPEKAGSTGIMPKDLIRSKILNWRVRRKWCEMLRSTAACQLKLNLYKTQMA